LNLEELEKRIAPAATRYWIGGAGNNNWSVANWDGVVKTVPAAVDTVVFDSNAKTNYQRVESWSDSQLLEDFSRQQTT
jgi:hypothetical protein